MDPIDKFNKEKIDNINQLGESHELKKIAIDFIEKTTPNQYSYNFSWMGRPIIAFPQDMIAMQELIWKIKPDLIIETGIAHGGSIVYYASLLELIGKDGLVVGIDIDIRKHNRDLIEKHPMMKRIQMIEGSSTDPEIIKKISRIVDTKKTVMVCLDSNHTHNHVLEELKSYSPFVTIGSYCVVFDTIIENMPKNMFSNRSWSKGNNPMTAIHEYLKTHPEFKIDKTIQNKLLITVAPNGYLEKIKS